MDLKEACEALKNGCRLEVRYSNQDRVVEVHAVGYTREEKPIMRAWQVRGGSKGGDATGWKLFRLEEIASSRILEEKSEAPRNGYKKGDPAIHRMLAQL